MITLDARPEPLSLAPATTAVLVVDMQNDFGAVTSLPDGG